MPSYACYELNVRRYFNIHRNTQKNYSKKFPCGVHGVVSHFSCGIELKEGEEVEKGDISINDIICGSSSSRDYSRFHFAS